VDGAYLHFESGDSPRADVQLQDVIAQLDPGSERARAPMRLARVRSFEEQAEAADLFLQAVDEAEGDREILSVAHEGVAACLFRLRERLTRRSSTQSSPPSWHSTSATRGLGRCAQLAAPARDAAGTGERS
jgi:hypothetical protein